MDFKNGVGTFVMPHYLVDNDTNKTYLDETLENIFNQTDPNWQLIIIDDVSPCKEAIDYLDIVKAKYPDKITIIKKSTNNGPGYCRNFGIKWAYEHNSPIVLFNDADDEFPAQCSVLFERRAENYLDAECLAIAGRLLFTSLESSAF